MDSSSQLFSVPESRNKMPLEIKAKLGPYSQIVYYGSMAKVNVMKPLIIQYISGHPCNNMDPPSSFNLRG